MPAGKLQDGLVVLSLREYRQRVRVIVVRKRELLGIRGGFWLRSCLFGKEELLRVVAQTLECVRLPVRVFLLELRDA